MPTTPTDDDWSDAYKFARTGEKGPKHWPSNVSPISVDGLSLIGVDLTLKKLYWDGKELELKEKIELQLPERLLGAVVAFSGFGLFILELGKTVGWWTTPS